jgi:hypothetical protein
LNIKTKAELGMDKSLVLLLVQTMKLNAAYRKNSISIPAGGFLFLGEELIGFR